MSRTFPADTFIKEVLHVFLHKKKSITKLLAYSEHWMEVFKTHKENINEKVISGNGIKHMKYAKQRVDSEMAPAGRFILLLEAVLMTAISISIERKGRVEGDEANDDGFLGPWLSETKLQVAKSMPSKLPQMGRGFQ